ncbi:MAG: hypothetical protein A2381_07155 [Bdellovibrionales bacterium RIFOXYB1_FULL_37_110]|nr:MAG: hypothetical protein A2417_15030 [Bdellovibrionales bacterium RIFOXYC1_FULL_37_79]OFZ57840.1 MAG: hypothetical protein A2381_07155 [Bdellovibrionales bacterium RIFOXYB1_FULL_37_110]OFZ62806.1 MAG: hypothetical protein A2577_16675 [Bdellovibrionales bacterium RIFOXYD1_FULL_36_51]
MFSPKFCPALLALHLLLFLISISLFAQENPDVPTSTPNATALPTPSATTEIEPPIAQTPSETIQESFFDSFIGVSYIPKATWSYPKFLNYEKDKLALTIDKNSFITYDANVRLNKIQTVLGLSAITDENTISGKIHRFSGYIGLKKMYFRLMKGKIAGNGVWNDTLATNMPARFNFDNSISSYDALYSFSEIKPKSSKLPPQASSSAPPMDTGFYLGLGITKGEVPATVRTLITTGGKENQKYGKFVYDKDYAFSVVSFLFGFDTITGTILADGVVPGIIQPYFSCYDRIGLGSGTISDESVRYAEELNPGKTFVDKKSTLAYLENNTSIGASWTPSFLKGKAIMAIGYNVFFNSIMPLSGAAETSTELGYDANIGMLRHGPEFRIFALW